MMYEIKSPNTRLKNIISDSKINLFYFIKDIRKWPVDFATFFHHNLEPKREKNETRYR